MKKIVLIPDSFKGTMSSREICAILAEEARKVWPEAETISIPVADGGEGSVDAFLAAVGGKRVEEPCKGPYWEDIAGFYGRLPGDTAVVEMAAAAGLPLAGDRLCPEQTTTYGVGQLIRAALRSGAKKVIVGLGGSATNDGGAGMAAALGVRFLRRAGEVYVPTGGTLEQLERIDLSGLDPLLEGADLVITGEGRIDSQSLRGKVVVGVARRAKASGVPVAALVGDIGEGAEAVCGQGVTGIFSTNRAAIPFAQARLRAKEDMRLTAANLFRFLGRMGH